MHVPEMFSDQNVYIPLRVDGGGVKRTQYNLYCTNHM